MSNDDIDGFEWLFIQKCSCHWPFASYETHLTLGKSSEKQLNKDVTVL